MSRRFIVLASASLVIAVVSSACGGSSATPAPTPPPAASSVAPGGAGGLPSFHPDQDLVSQFPKTVGGTALTVTAMSGNDLLSVGDQTSEDAVARRAQVQAFVSSQGKTIDDLSVGFGGGQTAEGAGYAVQAYRLKGADANALLTALLPILMAGATTPQTSQVQVAGKSTTQVTNDPSAGGQTSYLYPKNDIVWIVTATDPTLTEIFNQLP